LQQFGQKRRIRGKMVERKEEKQDQITLLWNAIIDLQQRVRKLERRLE
jgi:hypothetical protein